MPESLSSYSAWAVTALVTYLLHSTLLLVAAWAVIRVSRTKSHALIEQTWKAAAIAGIVTTSAHLTFGSAASLFQFSLADDPVPSTAALDHFEESTTEVSVLDKPANDVETHTPIAAPTPIESPVFAIQDSSNAATPASPSANAFKPDVPLTNHESRTPAPTVVETIEPPATHGAETPAAIASFHSNDESPRSNELTAALPAMPEAPVVIEETPIENSPPKSSTVAFLKDVSLSAVVFAIAIVIVALLGRLCLQTLAFGRRVSRLQPLDCELTHRLLDELRTRAGIRRRAMLCSSSVYAEPVAFGVFRWRIVLPTGLEHELQREELRGLLAHELAHLVRGDAAWLWIGHALCSLLAFQPLNFLARRAWRRAAEFQCDDWAVRQKVAPLALARCLTRVAERRRANRVCPASLSAVGATSTLSNRVERLVAETNRNDPWQNGKRRRLFAVAVMLAIFGLAVWGPSATMPAFSERPEQADLETDKAEIASEPDPVEVPQEPFERVDDRQNDVADFENERASEVELARLRSELNELLAESQALVVEAESSPELKPILDRLMIRIDELSRKIESLGSIHNEISKTPISL